MPLDSVVALSPLQENLLVEQITTELDVLVAMGVMALTKTRRSQLL